MKDFMTIVGCIVLFIVSCCALGLLFALPTMWLLNWLVPALIPGAAGWSITWIQAWGVNVLSNILFKGVKSNKNDD